MTLVREVPQWTMGEGGTAHQPATQAYLRVFSNENGRTALITERWDNLGERVDASVALALVRKTEGAETTVILEEPGPIAKRYALSTGTRRFVRATEYTRLTAGTTGDVLTRHEVDQLVGESVPDLDLVADLGAPPGLRLGNIHQGGAYRDVPPGGRGLSLELD